MGLMLHVEVKATADQRRPVGGGRACRAGRAGRRRCRAPPGAAIVVANHGANALVTLRYRLKDCEGPGGGQRPSRWGSPSYPAGSLVIDTNQAGHDVRDARRERGALARPLGREPGGDAGRRGARRRSAAAGDVQHVGQHAGGRLGAPRLRSVRGAVRPDLQGARPPRRSPRRLRRHPDPEPGPRRPSAWSTTSTCAARRCRTPRVPRSRRSAPTANRTTSAAAWASRASSSCRSSWRPAASIVTLGASSAFPADFGLSRTVTAARPTAQFYAPGPIVQAEIVKPDASDLLRLRQTRGSRCATPTARCCRCRSGTATSRC